MKHIFAKLALLFLVAIPATKQANADKICLTDNYGLKWDLEVTRVGDVRYVKGWVSGEETGTPYKVTGFYDYSTAKVELHAVRPKGDFCQEHYDSFTYWGNGGGYYDHNNGGDPFFGASGKWIAYCHKGKEVDNGTWQMVDCNHEIHLPKPGMGSPTTRPSKNVTKSINSLTVSPNPVVNSASIQYVVASQGKVIVTVYNYMQQPVKTLVNEVKAAGNYSIIWDGRSANGTPALAGLYKVVIVQNGQSFSTSIQVVR